MFHNDHVSKPVLTRNYTLLSLEFSGFYDVFQTGVAFQEKQWEVSSWPTHSFVKMHCWARVHARMKSFLHLLSLANANIFFFLLLPVPDLLVNYF